MSHTLPPVLPPMPTPADAQRALEADTNAVIKLVLTEIDDLLSLPRSEACEPYALDERKRRIKRRLWEHHRLHMRVRRALAEDV